MSPKRKKKAKKIKRKNKPIPLQSEAKAQSTDRKKRIWPLIWRFIAVLSTISGLLALIFFPQQITNFFKSPKAKWEEETFIKGILIPPLLSDANSQIIIEYGSNRNHFSRNMLEKGVDLKPDGYIFGSSKEVPFNLRLKIESDRLYAYAIFKDIQEGEVVGIIEYKKWKLFKDNLFDYYETDQSLKVLDRGGNVIFRLLYSYPNKISLKGYWVGEEYILVLSEGIIAFSSNGNRSGATKEIEKMSRSIE